MDRDAWLQWRAKSHGLVWRVALPEDMPAIDRLWRLKGRVVGNGERPDLFSFPVLLTIVAENDRGQIVDGAFLEAICDVTKLGASRQGFKSLIGIAAELGGFVRSKRMRFAYAIFPCWLVKVMGPLLGEAGFEECDTFLSHWHLRI